MKKALFMTFTLVTALLLVSCSGNNKLDYTNLTQEQFDKLETVAEADVEKVFENPDQYVGKKITLSGKVHKIEIIYGDAISYQMNVTVNGEQKNTLVMSKVQVTESDVIKIGDSVKVEVVILGKYSGDNLPEKQKDDLYVAAYKSEMEAAV